MATVLMMMILCVVSTMVGTEARPAQQVRLRGLQVSPPGNTSLSASEYEALLASMGGDTTTQVTSLYRTSVDGTTYGDLLDNVGDAKPLVVVVRKDKYVFGVYVSAGIQLPDDPTSEHWYGSDVWWFSLAGHFPQPTKIDIPPWEQWMRVAGRKANAVEANMYIGRYLVLGEQRGWPAAGIRSCEQYTDSDYLPEGYTGVRGEFADALMGGSRNFMADEIEVLRVVQ
ncbi:unnamed protein product [Vitrella brassicaformis CCMP3155]|uniref:TLDc domain-containing protein n=1 Tax=Vitrella brassicaformis (strain CCMP3155) TaxID=1169540 RepID=A0A0G4FBQ5_VITBC|nr:unnamed protein product [Vitrella brassicaformis CCMP3155]|eukprot:CEM10059.1 unnamed protein product [Vitrella brassicaformis CCMP3155]